MKSYNDTIKDIQQAIIDYRLKRKSAERDNLSQEVAWGLEMINELNAFDKTHVDYSDPFQKKIREELFPLIIEANSLLPLNAKYPIGDIYDFKGGEFLKHLPKSYLSYLPKGDIKNIKVKQILYKPYIINPKNAELQKVFEDWVSTDDLRPAMQGIYFDEYGATGTDMHKLLHIVGERKGDFEDGIYYTAKQIEYQKKKEIFFRDIIDAKYPNYRSVSNINNDEVVTSIDCNIMLNALETLTSNGLVNRVTYQILIKVNDKYFGFNAEFMATNFKTWLQMGVPKVDFYANRNEYEYNRRGCLFTEKGGGSYNQDKITYSILMPVMLRDDDYPTYIKIIDENNIDVVINNSPAYRFSSGQSNSSSSSSSDNSINLILDDLREAMEYMSENEKKTTQELINDLEEAQKYM